MIIIPIILFTSGAYLSYKEYKANCKRQQINKLSAEIQSNIITNNDTLNDSVIWGLSSVGLTLLDIYDNINNHGEVLSILEQRFPNANGELGVFDWFNKIEGMFAGNSDSLDTYISAFKGQAAENIALSMLQDKGLNASLFESLTHKADDIAVTLSNGDIIPYSVKCGNVFYIKDCIEQSSSTHYIINSESYNLLEQSGYLEYCNTNGIEIIDGGFSDSHLASTAQNAFLEIHDSGNISDSIPYIALGLFGLKTYQNYKLYSQGSQTSYEFSTNVAIDGLRVGAAGFFSKIGSDIGMTIGTIAFPGIGTVIGGGIGIFAGAFAGNSIFTWAKEKIKWGDIIKALDHFGYKYEGEFCMNFSSNAVYQYFDYPSIQSKKIEELNLIEKYKAELDPYNKAKISVSAIISQEYLNALDKTEKKINHTVETLGTEIILLCKEIAGKINPNSQSKFARRLLGELVIGNLELIDNLKPDELKLIDAYNIQKINAGNYPYQFNKTPEIVLEEIVKQIFDNYEPKDKSIDRKMLSNRIKIAFFFIVGLVLLFINV